MFFCTQLPSKQNHRMNIQAQVQHRLVGVDHIKHQEVGDGTILFITQLISILT